MTNEAHVTPLDDQALQRWPLPEASDDADKEDRGRVLIIGGARSLGGAVYLAGMAAMRAGAGKVTLATADRFADALVIAFPEARVVGLEETDDAALALCESLFDTPVDALLIGPGLPATQSVRQLVKQAIVSSRAATIILDAGAMDAVRDLDFATSRRDALLLLTPHAGEVAHLLSIDKREVVGDPIAVARRSAQTFGVAVALKGATTVIATPEGRCFQHNGGNAGLAVSGSGDVLAGIIAGLVARGATLEQAAAWGIVVHARAGDILARRVGRVGFLAREIISEVPAVIERISKSASPGPIGFTGGR
ncbi:MAG TPA: NAD(P)H-hydrate dehydratase [Casimicrobiaceae bacterium]|nr:NAD(P)H-hydrate dehydratase [Casimicrobiaceae bacterium]